MGPRVQMGSEANFQISWLVNMVESNVTVIGI